MLRRLFPYGVAIASLGGAVLARIALAPLVGDRVPFAPFFVATIVTAWIGGAGPGALALVLGAGVARGLFGDLDPTRVASYLVVGAVVVLLAHVMRAARGRAERASREELAARQAAEAARERSAFLGDANVALTASLDYEATLAILAELIVPRLADWCAVDVVEADGTVRRVAVAHADPAKADLARATSVYPDDPEGRHPRTHVIRTGRSRLLADVTPDALAAIAAHPEHLRVMRAMGYVSAMIVALVARGRTLGAITCAAMESGRRYDADDLALLEDLALRAALALDNARLYREADASRTEAERASLAKDEFLSMVSHELKTPLAATLGWLRVLRGGSDTEIARAMDVIERSVRSQAKLIDDLLDVSRMVAGRLHIDSRPVALADPVAAAIDLVRPAAEAKGVALELAIRPPSGPVLGDPDRLQQVVWNLLTNAVKFTPAGGTIRVELGQQNGQAELRVRDTGKGISEAFLPHVFERFRQAEPVASREKGGLGLGLAITHHLVALHGGRIAATSDGEGTGATFTVTLPLGAHRPAAGDPGAPLDREPSV